MTWLPIAGYEGIYEVSDGGQVRSLARERSRRTGQGGGGRFRGCMLRPGLSSNGYLSVSLNRDKKGHTYLVHQLVALAFIGPCPPGQQVRHGPGGRLDNRVLNLSYGTRKENYADSVRDGTRKLHPFARGASHPNARLTDEIVMACRTRYASGETLPALATEYGVHLATMRRAVSGVTWTHLPPV